MSAFAIAIAIAIDLGRLGAGGPVPRLGRGLPWLTFYP